MFIEYQNNFIYFAGIQNTTYLCGIYFFFFIDMLSSNMIKRVVSVVVACNF